jgi:hypothetical protein
MLLVLLLHYSMLMTMSCLLDTKMDHHNQRYHLMLLLTIEDNITNMYTGYENMTMI